MAIRVNVTSIDSIAEFRANLIVYLSKAQPALEEVSSEVARTRVWLQTTQRIHWEGIVKKRARKLEEAQAALFSARMSTLGDVSSAEQLALTKAKQAYEEAEGKLRVLRRWDRDFDNRTEPPARQLEKVHTILADEMTKALHYLTEAITKLDEYSGTAVPSIEADSPASTEQKTEDAKADAGGTS